MAEKGLTLNNDEEARVLYGRHDEHLKIIEKEFNVKIVARSGNLSISGEDDRVQEAAKVLKQLLNALSSGMQPSAMTLPPAHRYASSFGPANVLAYAATDSRVGNMSAVSFRRALIDATVSAIRSSPL